MAKRYLYGASIQGIQSFIFQTNRLKDVVGASEIVNNVCTDLFLNEFLQEGQLIVSAAGKILCIYSTQKMVENTLLRFPKRVQEYAPGITVSQAVVAFDSEDEKVLRNAQSQLEERLRIQRNRPSKSIMLGLMGMERSRTTGLPAIVYEENDFVDESTCAKRNVFKQGVTNHLYKKMTGDQKDFSKAYYDLKELTGNNDWIAVIHADGNGLGEVVAKQNNAKDLKTFSEKLDQSTIEAARRSCSLLMRDSILPIRPVVIGGDDLTVICKADIAVDFVSIYLKCFEEETRKRGIPLTACAGIAYMKSSYPFYYGYEMAEMLCGKAKEDAKSDVLKFANNGLAPSCMMFYKIQSSFVDDFSVIYEKELHPCQTHSYLFGPYYISEQKSRWTITDLTNIVEELNLDVDKNSAKSNIREWLTILSEKGEDACRQKEKRIKECATSQTRKLFQISTEASDRGDGIKRHPAYDILSLYTIKYQETDR